MMKVYPFIMITSFFVTGLLVGFIPQHATTIIKAVVNEGNVEFLDLHNDVVEPLAVKNSSLLSSEIDSSSMCLTSPIAVRTLASVFQSGYLFVVESQIWETTPEVSTGNGVTLSISGIVTCAAVAYNSKEKQDPHTENQPKAVSVHEPPIYLPPKRVRI